MDHWKNRVTQGTAVPRCWDQHQVSIDYSPGAPPINLVTDACLTGGSGYISQGEDMEKAKVVTFWSRKYTATQQNYTVHELELLAIVELLKCFQSYLIGTHFCVCTNHHSLKHFLTQKTLSSRQVRWLNVLSEFDFRIEYIAGKTNILADALSHIYSDKPAGVV